MSQIRDLIDSDDFDFRYKIGVSQPVNTLKLSDKERLIVDLMAKHFTILGIVKAELDQMFKCGLSSTLNILELVREIKGRDNSLCMINNLLCHGMIFIILFLR